MKTAILLVNIILSIMLVVVILLQAKGTGMGSSYGGSSDKYQSKRGVEKIVFQATVIITALFLTASLVNTLLG